MPPVRKATKPKTPETYQRNANNCGSKTYSPDILIAQGAAWAPQPFQFKGKTYEPPAGSHWKANYPIGMEWLAAADRLHVSENSLRFIRFADDVPWQDLNSL